MVLNSLLITLLAATPLSLIVIRYISRFFSSHDPHLADTTVICSDLTGTLTHDELKVKSIELISEHIKIDLTKNLLEFENRDTKENIFLEKTELKTRKNADLMAICANLCGYLKVSELEKIINKFFLECGFGKHKIEADYEVIQKIPSDPDKKISTVVAIKNGTKEIFAFSKGNPISLLEKCSRFSVGGKKMEMDTVEKARIRKLIKNMERDGQKLIGFAYKGLPLKRFDNYSENFTENDLIFLGVVGLNNPVNIELKPSIELAKEIGVKIYITSEGKERPAVSAGLELGIINPNYFESIIGAELEQSHEKRLHKVIDNKEKDFIFAEISPQDKIKIMEAFRQNGETVAVANKEIGNGLKRVLQGIIKERANKLNAKKYISHAFVCKIIELMAIFAALIAGAPLPFTIVSILILDLIINLILELALKSDKVGQKVVHQVYEKIDTKIETDRILRYGIFYGLLFTTIYFFNLYRYGWNFGNETPIATGVMEKIATINLLLLALIEIVSAYNIRSHKKSIFRKKISSNPYLPLTAIIVLLIIYLLTGFALISDYIGLSQLSPIDWQISFFVILLIIIATETRRYLKRKNEHPNPAK
ncbi:MAG: cation transporting ATPase C-terminal domain-containing protein [Candidatus Gracilibacteria bacterium]